MDEVMEPAPTPRLRALDHRERVPRLRARQPPLDAAGSSIVISSKREGKASERQPPRLERDHAGNEKCVDNT
jgi:hypothetical protein